LRGPLAAAHFLLLGPVLIAAFWTVLFGSELWTFIALSTGPSSFVFFLLLRFGRLFHPAPAN